MLLRDKNGIQREIPDGEVQAAITQRGFTLFGMDAKTIAELRQVYFVRGGELPITPESVRRTLWSSK